MRSRMRWRASLALAALAAGACTAGAATMSVQVKSGQLRATPSFLGRVVAPLSYGDRVEILETKNPWMRVAGPRGQRGWVHGSALTEKKIAMASGSRDAQTGASSDELALASKGFNSDVEADFKAKHRNVDFTWVDRMEKWKAAPEAMQAFLKDGGLKPAEGGAR
ncbi:MAG TPA: SH3 domain-containing protein [Planctomycetes bacterium]|nr:SH3 domain-containing protein [Planctomycetota bacterium]